MYRPGDIPVGMDRWIDFFRQYPTGRGPVGPGMTLSQMATNPLAGGPPTTTPPPTGTNPLGSQQPAAPQVGSASRPYNPGNNSNGYTWGYQPPTLAQSLQPPPFQSTFQPTPYSGSPGRAGTGINNSVQKSFGGNQTLAGMSKPNSSLTGNTFRGSFRRRTPGGYMGY